MPLIPTRTAMRSISSACLSTVDSPGMFVSAAKERNVRSPLREVGMTKQDIRTLSKQLGLPVWNKPAMACLSSRIPYGTPVTVEALRQVEQAEAALHALGLRQVRVRHHHPVARIEVEPEEMATVIAQREAIVAQIKAAGYAYVTLDLAGFRSGSLNEVLPAARRAGR